MNDFAGMEELLSDFLIEAGEMLSDVDSKLMELDKHPNDRDLLNEIFRDFHTIKGGAGFLNATELVNLCHLTENLFDKLRNGELTLSTDLMDVIFAATAAVRRMFDELQQGVQPDAAPEDVLDDLKIALTGQKTEDRKQKTENFAHQPADDIDWNMLYAALTGTGASHDHGKIPAAISEKKVTKSVFGRRSSDIPGSTIGRREGDMSVRETRESSIRVDTVRLDQVLNLSGEIGLIKNRLSHLRSDILQGRNDAATLDDLDQSVTQLDMLVVNLQNAVMKARMQPIGRLFKKYPRLARDLARQLGKDVELLLSGEETEMDKNMIEDLNDPLVHLVRNAVDHGVETIEERIAAGKPEKSIVELSVRQEGDHILIIIADDGRGMDPAIIRNKAIEKGLITNEMASTMDESQCLELIFLPGFSTKDEISDVSGRGVGMDVVKTNIQKLNGTVNIRSLPGKGTMLSISLPLTLAILPVLILRLCDQSFAVPLSMVREILFIIPDQLQQVSGRAAMVVRGEVLPVLPLAQLIGWEHGIDPAVGVLMQIGTNAFILSADSFVGHDNVVIKSLDTFRPKGVAGVTMSREGDIVLILDIKELLGSHAGIRNRENAGMPPERRGSM